MSAAPWSSHILYCMGFKGSLGGDLSGLVTFHSKAKTAPLDEAAVATVTVPQSPVGLQMPFSCPPSSLVHEELAGSVFSTIGTLLFFLGSVLEVNTSSVGKAALFSRPLRYVRKLYEKEGTGKLVIYQTSTEKVLFLWRTEVAFLCGVQW